MINHDILTRDLEVLSHPRRAKLYRLIARHPARGETLDQLQQATQLSYACLIPHLRAMERAGLIQRYRSGPRVAYQIVEGDGTPALAAAVRLGEAARSGPRIAA